MKKFSLLLCCFVALLVSQKVIATVTYPYEKGNLSINVTNGTLTINSSTTAGELNTFMSSSDTDDQTVISAMKTCTSLVLIGKFNSSDLEAVKKSNSDFSFTTVNMAEAEFLTAISSDNNYKLFTSSTGGSAYTSLKAIENVTALYQSTEGRGWNVYNNAPGEGNATLYESNTDMEDNKESASLNSYGTYPTGSYKYCQMSVTDESWGSCMTSNPGSAINVAFLENELESQKSNFSNGQSIHLTRYYRKQASEGDWSISYPSTDDLTFASNIGAHIYDGAASGKTIGGLTSSDYQAGDFVWFYVYYTNTNGTWGDAQTSDPGSSEEVSWLEDKIETNQWNYQNKTVKIKRYYCKGSYTWTQYYPTNGEVTTAYNRGVLYDGVGVNANINNLLNSYGAIGGLLWFDVYYTKSETRSWTGDTDTEQSGASVASFDYSYRDSHKSGYSNGQWVKMPIFSYYQLTSTGSYSWKEVSFVNGDEKNISLHISDATELTSSTPTYPASSHQNQYAVVSTNGDTDNKVFDGSAWVPYTSSTTLHDYSQIQFKKWSGSLVTAYLPSYVNLTDCSYKFVEDCPSLTKLYLGDDYAEKTESKNSTTNVTTVSVISTKEGLFNQLFRAKQYDGGDIQNGVVIKFFNSDSKSTKLNVDDLYVLAADNGEKGNYYVDLYDISTSNFERVIAKIKEEGESDEDFAAREPGVIDRMRTNNLLFKGLLLPKNPSYVGTKLIQDSEQNSSSVATCSEFIAYHNGATTGMHIYRAVNGDPTYETRLATLVTMMKNHEIDENTTSYFVSTNSPSRISNVSTLLQTETPSKTIIETIDNEMVKEATEPSIYVTLISAGTFSSVVSSSNIENTPNVKLIQLDGSINEADIAAINEFDGKSPATDDGPKVLDLKNATPTATTAMLNSLTNTAIEYIVLPAGMTKSQINSADYSDLSSLKAVISSNNSTLVAKVITPGSLAEARCLATGAYNNTTTPQQKGLTSVILFGSLNASDIAVTNATSLDGDGHIIMPTDPASGTGGNIEGLHEERGILTIDLSDAVFSKQRDMNFYSLGLTNQARPQVIKLPTSNEMTDIPPSCFKDLTTLTGNYICIPYNFQNIGDEAFKESEIYRVTTTDVNGAEIDNGMNTITLSANVKSIGERAFRLKQERITDVYVLAKDAPTCKAWAFGDASMYYGNGGHKEGDKVYCRDLYIKNDGDIAITVLHYPDGLTEAQEAKYTDITKVYTKKDQTGALDANGNPLYWPTRSEMNYVHNQALSGLLWDAWCVDDGNGGRKTNYDANNDVVWQGASATVDPSCTFTDYIGWHQFVLSRATYVPQNETVVNEQIIRNYIDDDWYTFCVPFDMTEEEVIELLGVPASHDNIVNKYYNSAEGITTAKLPEIYTLKQVNRTLNGTNGTVLLTMSSNLAEKLNTDGTTGGSDYTYYNPSTLQYEANGHTTADNRNKPIVIRGGYPYLIKGYKRDNETVKSPGRRVMNRYVFPKIASSVYRANCWTTMYRTGNDGSDGVEYHFASPYFDHDVKSTFTNDVTHTTTDARYQEGTTVKYYIYKFMGQYWKQPLPMYSYYVANNHWWYYKNYKSTNYWQPYQCVINVSSVLDTDNSSYYKYESRDGGGGIVFSGQYKLAYTGGHDDSFVTDEDNIQSKTISSVRIIFGDAIEEFDADGNEVSAIQKLDGQDIIPVTRTKIYNLKGQYVGNSVDDLHKGLYIVNGKKIVVD